MKDTWKPRQNNDNIVWYRMNSNSPGAERLAEGFGELNPITHSWILTSVSVGSIPHFYSFPSGTVRISVDTAPKCCTEPIRYMMFRYRDWRRAASLRYRIEIAPNRSFGQQKPYHT